MNNDKEFYVGEKVTCLLFGKGVVEKTNRDLNYPILVEVDNHKISYTKKGFNNTSHEMPTLYHGHVDFDIITHEVKEPVYEWQWLYQHLRDDSFDTCSYYKTESDMLEILGAVGKNFKRIEESKREVKS